MTGRGKWTLLAVAPSPGGVWQERPCLGMSGTETTLTGAVGVRFGLTMATAVPIAAHERLLTYATTRPTTRLFKPRWRVNRASKSINVPFICRSRVLCEITAS